jgi:hypothetical protein
VFEGWSHWTWVSIAWAQVVLAYGGYLAYLGWRKRRLLADADARRIITEPPREGDA